MKKIIATTLLASALATPAFAEGFYGAFDLGQSNAKDACVGVPAGWTCSNTATAFRIGAGYQFNPNVGVELNYADFGKSSASGTVLGTPVSSTAGATSVQGFVVGSLPLNENFAITAKAGLASTKVSSSVAIPAFGIATSASATSNKVAFGIGAKFNISPTVAIRAQYEDFGTIGDVNTTGQSKVTMMSAGITVGF